MRHVYSSHIWKLTFRSKLIQDENTPRMHRERGWSEPWSLLMEHQGFPTDDAMLEAMRLHSDMNTRKYEFQVIGCVQFDLPHALLVEGEES